MRKVDISEYGTRYTAFCTITAGEGRTRSLWIPEHPSMKHSMVKLLWLIHRCHMKTRKEILDYSKHPLCSLILGYKSKRCPSLASLGVHDYWAQLFREGYIIQWRDGKKIRYAVSTKGEAVLQSIPEDEKQLLRI